MSNPASCKFSTIKSFEAVSELEYSEKSLWTEEGFLSYYFGLIKGNLSCCMKSARCLLF